MFWKGYIDFIIVVVFIQHTHAQGPYVVNDGLGTVIGRFSSRFNVDSFGRSLRGYDTTTEVKINCRNVPGRGLVCSADYPDHCREQWNFPNPCTQNNIDMNVTKFVHPFDRSKFLMCGQMGKLYVVQCPQYEVFHEGCSQCIGADAGLTASCEVPLPPSHRNVCTREAILNNKLFFPFPGNLSRFIHCDIWGKPWERICTPGEVWSKWDVTCVLPHLLNPCNRPTTDLNYLYSHPCDPSIYLTCDSQGRAHEINCLRGEAFHEENQRCQPYADFEGQVLSSFCENYMFGFRQNHGNDGFSITDQSRRSQNVNGAISGITGMGFQRDNRGITIDRTSRKIDGSVSVMPNPSGQGSTTTFDLRGGQLNRETNLQGQGGGTASFDRTTLARGGSLEGQISTDGQGNFGGTLDVTRGSVGGSNSGMIGQGFLGDGSGTNFIDIREKSLSTDPRAAEFVDIRNTGTSGSRANMIDIRGSQTDASGRMVDIRGQGTGPGGMVDIRNIGSGSTGAGMVDIRGGKVTGTRNMVDIRGVSGDLSGSLATDLTDGMVDIRNQGSVGTGMVDIRGGQTTGTQNMIDIRGVGTGGTGTTGVNGQGSFGDGSGTNFIDIRGKSLSTDPRTSEFVDIRNTGSGTSASSANMIDIRGEKGIGAGSMVDIRSGSINGGLDSLQTDTSSGLVDIRGQVTGPGDRGSVSSGMVDIRGGGVTGTRNMVDIRGVGTGGIAGDLSGSLATDLTGGMVDIRNQGSSGTDMVDIRSGQSTGINEIDIRGVGIDGMLGSTGTDSSGSMVDMIGTGAGSSGAAMVDIRGGQVSGTKNMVDIRRVGTDGVLGDISSSGTDLSGGAIEIGGTGAGSSGTGMVDIRGGSASGTNNMVDIRGVGTGGMVGGTDLSGGMIDVTGTEIGSSGVGMVDIRDGLASGTNNMVDIRGGQVSGTTNTVDIRKVGTGGELGDISSSSLTDLSGGVVDMVGTGTGSSGNGMVDIRGRKDSGTNNLVDIRGVGTNGILGGTGTDLQGGINDITGTETGPSGTRMVDIRGETVSGTRNMVDIRGTGTNGMLGGTRTGLSGETTDITGTGTGSSGMVDIRGGQVSGTKNMVDIRRVGTGDALGDISSSGTGLSGRMIDMSGTGAGSSAAGMVDIRGGTASGTNNMVDIRGVGTNGMIGDINSSGTDLSGGLVDFRGTGTGTTGNGMIDIRRGIGSETKNIVDIRTGGTGGERLNIGSTGTDLSGGMIDITGLGTGSSGGGMVDIRGRQASGTRKMVDIRGSGGGIGGVAMSGSTVEGSMSGGSRFADNRAGQSMVDLRGSQSGTTGTNSWSSSGLGGVSSFDIRNQLGLNGQSSVNNIDRSGTMRTDTINIDGTIQGGRQGSGTIQDILNTWNQITETGLTSSTGTERIRNTQTRSNQGGNRRIINDLFTVHPSRLKMYDYSDIPFSEPCTQINLDEGRTHFRYRGHPHMFLQCDTSGRMHRMPCSTVGQDYFDPYTNTCVDGPVHVDNRIQ